MSGSRFPDAASGFSRMFDFVDGTSSDVGDFRDVPRLISAVANLASTDLLRAIFAIAIAGFIVGVDLKRHVDLRQRHPEQSFTVVVVYGRGIWDVVRCVDP
ncbi:MAG: hypothetical protein WCB11_15430 [Terriglobales bacterium]